MSKFQVYLTITAALFIVDTEMGGAAGKTKPNKEGEKTKNIFETDKSTKFPCLVT